MRTEELSVVQPTGSPLTVEQEVVTRAADDGTILDTLRFVESERDRLLRGIAEQQLDALQQLVALLGGPFDPYEFPTITLGE